MLSVKECSKIASTKFLLTNQKIILDPQLWEYQITNHSYSVSSSCSEDNGNIEILYNFYKYDQELSKKVYLKSDTVEKLFNSFFKKLESLESSSKINLLKESTLITVSEIPSDSDVMVAFLVWFYTYIFLIGSLRWLDSNGSLWFPVETGKSPYSYDDSYVDYMFDYNFMESISLSLEPIDSSILGDFRKIFCIGNSQEWIKLIIGSIN